MGQMLLMMDGTRTFLPYLRQNKRHHRPSKDRWIREHKCKQKAWEPPLIWLVWEILRDLYRSPLTGKLHFSKEFYLCFQIQELWYMFSLRFQPRVFNLAIKSHGFST